MTFDSYVLYAMSESVLNSLWRVACGGRDQAWCESTLAGILDDIPRDVLFGAYVAYVSPAASC